MTDEETRAYYEYWLKKPLWSYHEALILLACPPCPDMKFCRRAWDKAPPPAPMIWRYVGPDGNYVTESDKDLIIAEFGPETEEDRRKRKLLARPCVNALEASNTYVLMQRDSSEGLFPLEPRFPCRRWGMAEPMAIIEWALSKPSLTVPQPLVDWYYKQKAARRAIMAGEAAALALTKQATPTATLGEAASIPADDEEPLRETINIDPALCNGKTPQAIFDSLKEYGEVVIALVMAKKCGKASKTKMGKLFLPAGSDESVYLRKFNALVNTGNKRYIITFNEDRPPLVRK